MNSRLCILSTMFLVGHLTLLAQDDHDRDVMKKIPLRLFFTAPQLIAHNPHTVVAPFPVRHSKKFKVFQRYCIYGAVIGASVGGIVGAIKAQSMDTRNRGLVGELMKPWTLAVHIVGGGLLGIACGIITFIIFEYPKPEFEFD